MTRDKLLEKIEDYNAGMCYMSEVIDAVDAYTKNLLPSGKDWNKYMISKSILEDSSRATAYEAGFKDCLIEIGRRSR